jgi:hypothetical protein
VIACVRRAILEEAGYEVFASFPLEATMTLDSSTFSIGVVASDRADTKLIRTIRERFKDIQIIQISGFVNALGLTPETTGADDVIEKNSGERTNLLRAIRKLLKVKTRRPAVA